MSALGGGINRSTQHVCDTRSSWQHGSNENANDLLRHYFPKGADLSGIREVIRIKRRVSKTSGHVRP